MDRSAHIVANLFAQVVCLLHLHATSWNAMPVAAMPISEQAEMESHSNGGAMIATNFALRSMKEWPMELRTPSSAVNVMYFLQHAGFTLLTSKIVQKPFIGVKFVMKEMRNLGPIRCVTLIHLTPYLKKMLVQPHMKKRLNPDMRKRLNHTFRKMLNNNVRMLL